MAIIFLLYRDELATTQKSVYRQVILQLEYHGYVLCQDRQFGQQFSKVIFVCLSRFLSRIGILFHSNSNEMQSSSCNHVTDLEEYAAIYSTKVFSNTL